ncbi:MAG: polyphosphate polymerase domain-containing protein [Lachnospiraceae bacterium]|nr:polyphosphate polymerase domain-containing protein [Lachnospiraceae bacterium]
MKNEKALSWRHEYKFRIDARLLAVLSERAKQVMEPDSHAGDTGLYQIRSVYFDDYQDSCYRQNEAGTDPRVKYRVRCYNGDDGYIRLERKSKKNGMTAKESCALSREQAEDMIRGRLLDLRDEDFSDQNPVYKDFVCLQRTRLLRPKVLVIYNRRPFVNAAGNVRVTFDQQISAGMKPEQLFEAYPFQMPILPLGESLMEVKYDALLPDTIRDVLSLGKLRQETFSKYYLCRREERKLHEYIR